MNLAHESSSAFLTATHAARGSPDIRDLLVAYELHAAPGGFVRAAMLQPGQERAEILLGLLAVLGPRRDDPGVRHPAPEVDATTMVGQASEDSSSSRSTRLPSSL